MVIPGPLDSFVCGGGTITPKKRPERLQSFLAPMRGNSAGVALGGLIYMYVFEVISSGRLRARGGRAWA